MKLKERGSQSRPHLALSISALPGNAYSDMANKVFSENHKVTKSAPYNAENAEKPVQIILIPWPMAGLKPKRDEAHYSILME